MDTPLFLSLLGFLWAAAVTPGPNNMLLTSSSANLGFYRSLPLMLGIMLGMQTLLLLIAFGVGSLLLLYPTLHTLLKGAGSLYLLYIAWKVTTSRYTRLSDGTAALDDAVSWRQGWLLQFLNPKAWLMALGAVTSFSLPGERYLTTIAAISLGMCLVNLLAGALWLGFGTLIGRLLQSRRAWFTFNLIMGTLTAACVLLIWR
ncbi:LysE family translocator [Edwardsiella ictaluri]|uniref:Translocator protein, LysE family n=2 Tax=Edwardsiella ictaluri TaxID=67780 RepID=C5B956_EDWI9|nr:LysE family translocator [Edwardsiella ictaluri]ACR70796.1 translocator protein, LysE family [Edwardsiella ictaluri 93-146]ARD39669.1 alcohol dehydrogenase [Edwardsiella ictaluri]AVZ82410.1 LysE family translocator [Edwardsiella ictaluri]EKS7762905.1 LysE family translocator [Edwardsiella ictaluri]EKS7769817.1 LysE family translocator [Edwardsiella ictaluri]